MIKEMIKYVKAHPKYKAAHQVKFKAQLKDEL
jgi:hypothetical protein